MAKSLPWWHYNPPKIDDAFSKKVYSLEVKRLDPQKRFLIQEDLDSLSRFETDIDNELNQGSLDFFDAASALLRRRIQEAQTMTAALLETQLDLNVEDSLPMEPEKLPWAKNK